MITIDGAPVVMPMMLFEQADPTHLRTYYEKRDLVERASKYRAGRRSTMPSGMPQIAEYTREHGRGIPPVRLWPLRIPLSIAATGALNFLEVNLNCNLWSEKVFGRSAELWVGTILS